MSRAIYKICCNFVILVYFRYSTYHKATSKLVIVNFYFKCVDDDILGRIYTNALSYKGIEVYGLPKLLLNIQSKYNAWHGLGWKRDQPTLIMHVHQSPQVIRQ